MFHCSSTGLARACALATMVMLAFAASAAAQELRTVLASGDDVPRLGRIGVWGLHLVGLDDRGRALVSRVDNEHEESVWADGERFVPLVDPAAGDVELFGQTLALHPAGPVVGFGFRRGGSRAYDTIYSVTGGRVTQVARVGDRDAEGNTICEIHNYSAINSSGAVAFAATVTPTGYECGDLYAEEPTVPYYDAVYLADGGLIRVGGVGPLSPPGWIVSALTLWSLSEAGEAIVHGFGAESPDSLEGGAPSPPGGGAGQTRVTSPTSTGQIVLALGRDGARLLYRTSAADGPTDIGVGEDAPWFQVLAVSRAGEVVFRRREAGRMGLYRTDAGQVRRLFSAGDPAPWGGEYEEGDAYGWPSSFNERGDLLLTHGDEQHLVLYPAEGPAREFPGRALSGALNQRGDVAVLGKTSDESLEVVRYRNGNARRLAATGDRLPGGGALTARGLGASCMAPNGAVAAVAQVTSGAAALVCGDTRGFRPVSRMGDPRPDGRRFYSFDACAFAGSDAIVFIGSGIAPSGRPRDYLRQSAVYRALPQRLERVFGPGDTLADGAVVTALPIGWTSLLDADASGRVLALANTSAGNALVVAEADGSLARLPLRLRTSDGVEHVIFDRDSSVDHEYLSGISERPRRTTAPGGRSALRAAAADDPYYDPDAVWPFNVGLAASGGAFILGSQIEPGADGWPTAVLLYVHDDAVLRIAAAGSNPLRPPNDTGGFPGPPFDSPGAWLEALRVNGDRVTFLVRAEARSIFTYALGDAAPTEVVRSGDPTPVGTLTFPYPRGIGNDGSVYFVDRPQGSASRQFVFVWQDGTIRVVGSGDSLDAPVNALSDAGALLMSNGNSLRVSGADPSGATCPHPPTAIPPPLPPTPTPHPGEELPPDLPFEPQTCAPGTVCLHVGTASGSPGARVQVDVWLESDFAETAGTENELHFPPLAEIRACARNEAISKGGTAFSITPERTKAIVISLFDSDPIPNGAVLYNCEVEIAADAAPGPYQLSCAAPGAGDPRGTQLPASCADGVLTVEHEASGDAPQLAAGHSGSGCAIQPGAAPSASPVLLIALVLMIWRAPRRRRRVGRRPS